MEKAKDGVTLIADAIRREMAEEEKKKATTNNNPTNVIDVTAQFSTPEPKKQETPPPEPKKQETPPNDGNTNNGNDDGTMYKNE